MEIYDEFDFPIEILEQVINGFLDKEQLFYVEPIISTYNEEKNEFETKISVYKSERKC